MFATGGLYVPSHICEKQRQRREEQKNSRRIARGKEPLPLGGQTKGGVMMKRILGQEVVYLMIVNMPSDKDIAAAKARLAEAQQKS
jgi:hypothetical protein